MKNLLLKIAVVVSAIAAFGIIGRMDHDDQVANDSVSAEIRARLMPAGADLPSLKEACFSPSSYLQHCQSKLSPKKI
jgi:hypothetical protein